MSKLDLRYTTRLCHWSLTTKQNVICISVLKIDLSYTTINFPLRFASYENQHSLACYANMTPSVEETMVYNLHFHFHFMLEHNLSAET